jgi:hypothetical protein
MVRIHDDHEKFDPYVAKIQSASIGANRNEGLQNGGHTLSSAYLP